MLLLFLVPAFPVTKVFASSTANTYNFSVTPGTYDPSGCGGIGCWNVPPNTLLTVNGSTNDLSITNITMTGSATPSGNTFSFEGTPSACSPGLCLTGTIPASNDVAGDTWNVVVTFFRGTAPQQTVHARIFPTILVTPEFPIGSLLAIIATLGAFGAAYLFAKGRRRLIQI